MTDSVGTQRVRKLLRQSGIDTSPPVSKGRLKLPVNRRGKHCRL